MENHQAILESAAEFALRKHEKSWNAENVLVGRKDVLVGRVDLVRAVRPAEWSFRKPSPISWVSLASRRKPSRPRSAQDQDRHRELRRQLPSASRFRSGGPTI